MVYVLLAAKKNILSWWVGLFNVACYTYIYFHSQLYADVILQLFYLSVTIYGLISWKTESVQFQAMKLIEHFKYIVESFLISVIIYWLITHLNIWLPTFITQPASFAISDSLVVGFSIAATRLVAQKKIESWLWWILIDLSAAIIYLQKELYITFALFVGYALLALWAYIEWRKELLRE
ncbi:MAG: nicotinamide mononucleotide transporter [Bacteroidetes bacterium]|nr:nicotinamide mononucleotide transporter [Bacteroidota bacterium]